MHILFIAFTLVLSLSGAAEPPAAIEIGKKKAFASAPDPNDFLKDRDWQWVIKDYGTVYGTSRYIGEPISKPNLLKLNVVCAGEENKYYPIVDGFKYCGLTSISPAGKVLVVHFMDWDDRQPNSCTRKRVERVPLPDICSKTASLKKANGKERLPTSKGQ